MFLISTKCLIYDLIDALCIRFYYLCSKLIFSLICFSYFWLSFWFSSKYIMNILERVLWKLGCRPAILLCSRFKNFLQFQWPPCSSFRWSNCRFCISNNKAVMAHFVYKLLETVIFHDVSPLLPLCQCRRKWLFKKLWVFSAYSLSKPV